MDSGHASVVLLGAGASKEAGVPTTHEMTKALVDRISEGPLARRHQSSALNFVCATISAYDAATKGSNPYDSLDVERVFAAVELLAERRELEVTPFVASWLAAVDAWDQAQPHGMAFFDNNLQRAILEGRGGSARKLITDLITSVTGSHSTGATYRQLARWMLTELRELVAVTPEQLGYLEPLVEQGARNGGLTIATLNYDLAIEGAAELRGAHVSTGMREWIETSRWTWPDSGIRLLKLHGSIDWFWTQLPAGEGEMPQRVVLTPDVTNEDAGTSVRELGPGLIFGQRGKLRAGGPFLSLLAEFENQLAGASRIIVIGYSFRDDHVNELIRRWIADDTSRTILVVDPVWPSPGPYPSDDFRIELSRYLVPPRRTPDAFKARLIVWKKTCGQALQELVSLGFDSELSAFAD
jgi:SIR2-like domain